MSLNSMCLLACERRAVAPDRQLVAATGEGELASGPRLTDALRAAQADARHVVLDLERTTFMDMSGVRILLAAAERARAATGTFAIVHPTPSVRRMLILTGADCALSSNVPPAKGAGDAARAASPLPARARRSPLPSRSAAAAL